MSNSLRVCKKCLIRAIDEEKYFADLSQYIENLEEDIRVDQTVYEERLTLCGTCQKQINGMCKICGCYVELRAALKVRKCPDIPPKWERQME